MTKVGEDDIFLVSDAVSADSRSTQAFAKRNREPFVAGYNPPRLESPFYKNHVKEVPWVNQSPQQEKMFSDFPSARAATGQFKKTTKKPQFLKFPPQSSNKKVPYYTMPANLELAPEPPQFGALPVPVPLAQPYPMSFPMFPDQHPHIPQQPVPSGKFQPLRPRQYKRPESFFDFPRRNDKQALKKSKPKKHESTAQFNISTQISTQFPAQAPAQFQSQFRNHVQSKFPLQAFQEDRNKLPLPHQQVPIYETSAKQTHREMVKDAALQASIHRAELAQARLAHEKTKKPAKKNSNGGVPDFVKHIVTKSKAKNGPTNEKKVQHQPEVGGGKVGHHNPNDILKSLDPEKLNQLRQLLNAAATAKTGNVKKGQFPASSSLEYTSGSPTKRRLKRAVSKPHPFPFEYLSEQTSVGRKGNGVIKKNTIIGPRQCLWKFKKTNKKCKLVVRMKYWLDTVKDCSKEYLEIRGTKNIEK